MPAPVVLLTAARQLQAVRAARRPGSPAELARRLDPKFRVTPTIRLLSDVAVRSVNEPDQRDIVTTPPRTGKSQTMVVWNVVWALMVDPDLQIVVAAYGDDLAEEHSRKARTIIKDHSAFLGYRLAQDKTAVKRWTVEGHHGGLLAAGIESGITGMGANVLLIDDPVKDQAQADSKAHRKRVLNEFRSTLAPRVHPGGSICLIQCMTGDTPVLMASGVEKPLRDVRPGDEVATYDGGQIRHATVRNWACQGPDRVYRIRMKSGRTVRANARHPFLTIKGGIETWQRTDSLRPGSTILTAIGVNGVEPSARPKDAVSPSDARACACPTTGKLGGHRATEHPQSIRTPCETGVCGTVMESTKLDTMSCSPSRAVCAPSVRNHQHHATPEPIGTGSSALTTTMTLDVSAVCSAMTATSLSDTESLQRLFAPPLTTWTVTPDEVVEVIPCGVEDVFDLQIDRTENFIANGLVSHNTRWHEEDLAGALLAAEPDVWRHTNIPAVAERKVPDALGRQPGVAMVSALGYTAAHYAAMRRTSGERAWYALYMGVPSTPEGGLVKQAWLEVWRLPVAPSAPVLTVVGVDPSDSGSGDSCGLVAASVTSEGVIALIADKSAPMTSDAWARAAVQLAVDVGASEIAIEGFSARETYTRVAKEAVKRAQKLGALNRSIRVSSWPPKGSGRGGGDAVARSSALLQALETGTCRLAGHFPELEDKAVLWQLGQHQPDSLAALVVAHDVLVHAAGLEWDMADPGAGLLGGVASGGNGFTPTSHGGSVTAMGDWMRQSVG